MLIPKQKSIKKNESNGSSTGGSSSQKLSESDLMKRNKENLERREKRKKIRENNSGLEKHIQTKGKINEILDSAKNSAEEKEKLRSSVKDGQSPSGTKAGQGDIEKLLDPANELRTDIAQTPEEQSALLMKLATFSRFENVSDKSVLAKYNEDDPSSLSDLDKWALVVGNSELMEYIADNMTINKIIPDSKVKSIIEIGKMHPDFADAVGGSVANSSNYEGLKGSEAVSNFGLDYGGYQKDDKSGMVAGDKDWGLSPYVEAKVKGNNDELDTVKNVFYVQMKVPKAHIQNIKVPIHSNLRSYASTRLEEVQEMLDKTGKLDKKIVKGLEDKKVILKRFLKCSTYSSKMAVSTKEDGSTKNPHDPLTNLGMTKPSSRLKNSFTTINQEYHLGDVNIPVPESSGLWLKDETGKDTQIATFARASQTEGLKWVFDQSTISKRNAAIKENQDFHDEHNKE